MRVIVLIIILVLLAYLFTIKPRFKKPEHEALYHPVYYAHRGLHDNAGGIPENSMAAFRLAVEKGYGIEMDVQLSADGEAVVFHDADLKRICGVDKKVNELTLKELQQLSLLGTDQTIPTFKEFLELVDGKVPLIVEIKMEKKDDRIPFTVNEHLKHYKGVYCMESFHPSALIWYKKNRNDVFRGQLCSNFKKDGMNTSFALFVLSKLLTNCASAPDFIAYNIAHTGDLSRTLCCKLLGAVPVAWTIRSQEELDRCRKDYDIYIFEGFIPKE